MCVIIHKPKGVLLDEKSLWFWWEENHDYCGAMAAVEGKAADFHALTLNELLYWLKKNRLDQKEKECAIHLRQATSGEINPKNAHPFNAGDCFLMQNGVIRGLGDCNCSDTFCLAAAIRRKALNLHDPMFSQLFHDSVFVLLNKKDNEIKRILGNNRQGFEHQGLWYSRSSGNQMDMKKLILQGKI